jgi:Protein of unknown function (DUF1207)
MRQLVAGPHSLPAVRSRLALTVLRPALTALLIVGGAARLAAQWQPLPPADAVARAADNSSVAPDEPPSAVDGVVNNDESWVYARPEPQGYAAPSGGTSSYFAPAHCEPWTWQLLPSGLIYRSYLAGTKEPRIASVWTSDINQGSVWDVTLGGRVGIIRYGTGTSVRPEGWQLDIEGAAMPRLDPALQSTPLVSTDYRFGIPLTFGYGRWQTKVGYYHVSSHLGDEFMQLNPSVVRINYTRDSFIAGVGYFPTDDIRLYGEVGVAAVDGGAKPVEFQFGAEYSPVRYGGAPFAAVNGYTREDVDFGGNFVAQCGWQWRGGGPGHLLRVGFEFYNGKSDQFEFFNQYESRVGGGIWYDF